MNKSVLVIDTPKSCAQCPLLNGSDECVMQDASENFNADSFDDLMNGCPLKSLPEKKSTTAPVSNYEVQKNLFAAGWNSCIDKIIGKGKDI